MQMNKTFIALIIYFDECYTNFYITTFEQLKLDISRLKL